MNRRHLRINALVAPQCSRGAVGLTVLCGLLLVVAQAHGQAAPPSGAGWSLGQIPITVIATTPMDPGTPALIDKYLPTAVASLVGDDANKRREARNGLIASSDSSGQNPADAQYLLEYAKKLNKIMEKELAKKPGPLVRLNIAIVVARVANNAKNAQLAPVTLTLVNDPSDAVSLWGLKAAADVLSWQLNVVPLDLTLAKAIGPAVAAHGFNGLLTNQAYLALANAMSVTPPPQPVFTVVVPEMIKLYRARVDVYKDGIPDDPSIEQRASSALARGAIWAALTAGPKGQQTEVLQIMSDLLTQIGRKLNSATPEQHEQYIEVLKNTARALVVIGGSPAVPATSLANVNTAQSNAAVQAYIAPVVAAIKIDFPQVQLLPGSALSTTEPTTQMPAPSATAGR